MQHPLKETPVTMLQTDMLLEIKQPLFTATVELAVGNTLAVKVLIIQWCTRGEVCLVTVAKLLEIDNIFIYGSD